ncbi:hypothetical protein AKJ45_00800 [candidate division MSBL1 archaeon SCGC-AAA261F19]|uniref:Radical SAM core domain-containing protein n=1 Tax=candidate division MSBL1 archaeon SCGC-AAA261F19 TaxID=1698275 RepID=A0A133VBD2_9EURY|nr:hypothetical protein AKJ45_00800 [candidate division MSBL1 archaeon SCGC-AAA261F19]
MDCLHCCTDSGEKWSDELDEEEVLDFCEKIAKSKVPYVALGGGEPLLHPQFFEICQFFKERGISVKVETDGHLIKREDVARIADLNLRSIQISLDGASPEIHEKVRKGGNWGKNVETCKYLVQGGVNTEIVFTPTRLNIGDLEETIDIAASLDASKFYTGRLMRIGRAARNWLNLAPSKIQYEQFADVLERKRKENEGEMDVLYYPRDVREELRYRLEYPPASLLVLPNGKVGLFDSLPFICGNVKKQSIPEIWNNFKKSWRMKEVTGHAKKIIDNPALGKGVKSWREVSLED